MGSVSRSKSFNSPSFLFSRNKYAACTPTSSLSRSCSRASKYAYLGQNIGPPNSGHPSLAVIKVNPNKTTHAISGLKCGLRGAIQLVQEQVQKNCDDLQGQQTAKGLQLQLKTLEYQLSRLESLEEEYTLQQKLREGVRSMAYAYTTSTGIHQKVALANVKAGFRECTETLGKLEGQLQEFLGAFHFTMKGIQGFARLCSGDTYEITVKHGMQKWKTRTKVTKDGTQEWDIPEAKVRAILGEDLFIKAAEIKILGKQLLLGNKFCEICELFSAYPQLMTVNLNPSGSLKLNIIVQWDPLAQFYAQEAESPIRKRRIISPSVLKQSRKTPNPMKEYPSLTPHFVQTPTSCCSSSETSEYMMGGICIENCSLADELRENLNKLASILDDEIQGQFPELEMCEVNISALRRIASQEYNRPPHSSSPNQRGSVGRRRRFHSSSSLNIESALEAFDFLDSCDVNSPPPKSQPLSENIKISSISLLPLDEEKPSTSKRHCISNGNATTTTTDSGVSSLNSNSSNSRSCSPDDLNVTGSEQLDLVLNTHIQICLRLVNNIGAFGPLKWKEKKALTKLQQQGIILGNILNRINDKDDDGYLFELDSMPFIQTLWTDLTQTTTSLCATADQVAYGLEREVRKFHKKSTSLAKFLVLQILDEFGVDTDTEADTDALFALQRQAIVTVFQFLQFLKPYHTSFQRLVMDVAEERLLIEQITSGNNVEAVLEDLGHSVPSRGVFLPLLRLLSQQNQDPQVCMVVTQYFFDVAKTRKREVLQNCVDILESEQAPDRRSALELLNLILQEEEEGHNNYNSNGWGEVMEKVAYLAQTDKDTRVKEFAKRMLLSHKEGGRILAQLTLNSHGFQGLMAN